MFALGLASLGLIFNKNVFCLFHFASLCSLTTINYVFTEIERRLIENYLNTGIKVQDFYVLLNRIKATYPRLREDMSLIENMLEKEKR